MEFNTVLVVVIGVVILGGIALWFGRGMKIHGSKDGFSLETESGKPENTAQQNVSVGKNLEIDDAEVGGIAGVDVENPNLTADTNQNVDVLEGGKITRSSTGDIVGVKQGSSSDKDSK